MGFSDFVIYARSKKGKKIKRKIIHDFQYKWKGEKEKKKLLQLLLDKIYYKNIST